MHKPVLALSLVLLGVAACTPQVKAPSEKGVCYAVSLPEEGSKAAPVFNEVARDQSQIEFCAARLEQMRVRFLRLGGSRTEIVGSYQGQFLFIDRAGVWQSPKLEGARFFALARTGDGRLAVPGTIERERPAAK